MVIFTDGLFPGPGAFVSPTAPCQFPWGTRTTIPVDWRNSARQSLRLCWQCFVPFPLQGRWPCCPPCPPTAAPNSVSARLVSLSPCSQASLCPAMAPPLGAGPVCELGCASESTGEWGSKFSTGNLLGRRQALLCSPVLYQGGPTLIAAGFLGSASEHWVFTRWVLCSLTCMLQSKLLLVCGSGKGAG